MVARVALDLDEDTGAIVSVVRERSPLAIYDAVTAADVNRALADAVGAKSAAFVPLLSEGDVVGVLVAATTASHRNFTPAELDLVQGLASEAALALGRTRSNEALRAALERERLVAEIGRRVRSELDLETVLQVAVEETAKAFGVTRPSSVLASSVSRCRFSPNGTRRASSPWAIWPRACRRSTWPPASGRTVAVDDVEASDELADPEPRRPRGAPRPRRKGDARDADRRLRPGDRRLQPAPNGEDALAPRRDRAGGGGRPGARPCDSHGPAARRERAAPAPPGDADPGRAGPHQ